MQLRNWVFITYDAHKSVFEKRAKVECATLVVEFKNVIDVVIGVLIGCFKITFVIETGRLTHLFKELKVLGCDISFLNLYVILFVISEVVLMGLVDVVFFVLLCLFRFSRIFITKFITHFTLWLRSVVLRVNWK